MSFPQLSTLKVNYTIVCIEIISLFCTCVTCQSCHIITPIKISKIYFICIYFGILSHNKKQTIPCNKTLNFHRLRAGTCIVAQLSRQKSKNFIIN